jgi:predicted phage terminase large subunit-like protein
VVGQVWGRNGADFYLLDQKRGRWDFDETVAKIQEMTDEWPQSSAKLVEAQTLGAALSSHLNHKISGIIPISVKGSKELRALNCVPVWQSMNVYLPKPDQGEYVWIDEFVRELLTFPNAANDDQIDATTLALNQLRETLFPESKACAVAEETIRTQPIPDHFYWLCWIPARQSDRYTVLIYDMNTRDVIHFGKYDAEPIEKQLDKLYATARTYNGAGVRAFDTTDEALLFALEVKGVFVERVKLTKKMLIAAYENLSMLIKQRLITYPRHEELLAELEVFKSGFTFDESAEYDLQIAAQSAIHALCLATYDVTPEVINYYTQPSVYFSYDREFIERDRR